MTDKVYQKFKDLKTQNRKAFAVLIDPDDIDPEKAKSISEKCSAAQVDFVFFGGSIMISEHLDACITAFKSVSDIPVVLFPGSPSQVCKKADALLYLSLISGRNPDLLIGQHVISAPAIKTSGLEVISTGYMVIDGGVPTTVSYMSHSSPIPHNKPDLALCTAWAGEMQGKHVIYMDAGSGAKYPISKEMIEKVSKNISLPLIIGGGIRDAEGIKAACAAGAQVVVVGNAIEKDEALIYTLSEAVRNYSPNFVN